MENKVQKIKICRACGDSNNIFFSQKNGFDLYKCLTCQSIFLADLPTNLSEIYNKKYFWGAEEGFGYVDYDKDKEPMKETFEKCLNYIENKINKGRILDIGSATGYFLNIAKEHGWEVEGVEIGDDAAEVGRKKGLNIETGTIADIKGKEKFEAITMFDVIEHVSIPKADLEKAKELIKKDGILVIITPNSGSFYAKLLGKRWHLIVPPEHVTLFNKKSLSRLLKEVGFEILEIRSPSKSFTVEYIIHTLLRWQKLNFWSWALNLVKRHPFIAKFRLPINFRDNMIIFCKK